MNTRLGKKKYISIHISLMSAIIVMLIVFGISLFVPLDKGEVYAVGTRVQTVTGNNGEGGTLLAATWPSATTAGNLLVAILNTDGGTNITATPPAGWSHAVTSNHGKKLKTAIYYIENASPQSGIVIWTVSSTEATLTLAEYSGIATFDALDVVATERGKSLSVDSGITSSTAQADSVAIAGIGVKGIVTFSDQTNGFTEVSQTSSSSEISSVLYEKILSASGTQQVLSTVSSKKQFAGAVAVFKAATILTLEQSGYRFFNNENSTDIGAPLAGQDAAASLSTDGDAFRLRMLTHVNSGSLPLNGENFKLQFASQVGAVCNTNMTSTDENYVDVTDTTAIAFNDNGVPVDGTAFTANAHDPTHSADIIVNQTYEELNNFTNSQSPINADQDAKWDFSLIDNDGVSAATYCFRVVTSSGTTLDDYTAIPEITTFANSAPNNPPTSTVPGTITQATNGSGEITFSVTIADADSEESRVKVEYSDDGGANFFDPDLISVTPNNGVTDLDDANTYQIGTVNGIDTDDFGSVTLTIVWDTQSVSNGNGSLDGTDQSDIQIRVTPNDSITDGTAATSASFTVDNIAPTVTTANISVTGATGTSGAFKNGDTAVPTWNNTAGGDNNSDIGSVSFNVADFKATDTALAGSNSSETWTGTLSGALDSQDDTNNNTTVTVTDDAGNVTVTAGTNNYVIDAIAPTGLTALTAGATGDTTQVLNWTAVTETSFDHYEIWFGTVQADVQGRTGTAIEWDDTDDAVLITESTTSTTINGLSSSTTYYFKVFAVDNAGNEETVTDIITTTTLSLGNNAPTSTVPGTITQATNGSGEITFSVTIADADSQESRVKVEYSDDGGANFFDPDLISMTSNNGITDLDDTHIYQIGSVDGIDTDDFVSVTLIIVWDTQSSLNENGSLDAIDQSDIQIRVTPNDFIADGSPTSSASFIIDNMDPTVTDSNIFVASTGSGTGGAFVLNDIVTVVWINAVWGDNNTEFSTVSANLSDWGGGTLVTLRDTTACGGLPNNDIYEACFTLFSGSIDMTDAHASVSVTDAAGNLNTTADSIMFSVDTDIPGGIISAVTPSTGTSKTGDTVRLTVVEEANEAGVILSGTINGVMGTNVIDYGNGTYTIDYIVTEEELSVASGLLTASLIFTDAVGNVSPAITALPFNALSIATNPIVKKTEVPPEQTGGTVIFPSVTSGQGLIEPLFTTSLQRGDRGDDVTRLQQLLATDISIYPEGIVSGFFGSLTERAVGRFQIRYGVVSSSTSGGHGRVGPRTRTKLNKVFGGAIPVISPITAPLFTTSLDRGDRGDDVTRLQQLLATDSIIYPEGIVSGFYGSLTERAVGRFQLKYAVVSSSTSGGHGRVGPRTRAKLNEVFAGNIVERREVSVSSILEKGDKGGDVTRLQQLLATDISIYPEGIVSGFFGSLTERAVGRFQLKYAVVSSPANGGYGRVGPRTRAKLNEIYGQ